MEVWLELKPKLLRPCGSAAIVKFSKSILQFAPVCYDEIVTSSAEGGAHRPGRSRTRAGGEALCATRGWRCWKRGKIVARYSSLARVRSAEGRCRRRQRETYRVQLVKLSCVCGQCFALRVGVVAVMAADQNHPDFGPPDFCFRRFFGDTGPSGHFREQGPQSQNSGNAPVS